MLGQVTADPPPAPFTVQSDVLVFSEFSERSEQPPASDLLRSSNWTASPQLHQHHVSTSVSHLQHFQQKIQIKTETIISFSFNHKSVLYSLSWFPVLRDALLLIERQSGALQTHTEHFLSSILSAMDSLTQPTPVQRSREDDPHPVEVQGSTM